ncbi:MarR family transcriptional regulator [Nonomuraea mesophila]|uniref:MarR family transcriptional regulator n=1 Tax=Nonomuraea mesophila TaxID=2530382 RepID=A0A4R5F8T2_9ACTN|nr:MarR family transcriptional regulator [Nonomuraea mesophila]TDE44785.1 MarR family transcriptional regulator [Nonomuraea mesophila]
MEQTEDHVDQVVRQWRAERPDIDPSSMGVIGRISRAAQTLSKRHRAVFARHDLQPWEFDILATLRRSGPPYRMTAGALGGASMVTSGAITNRIDHLVSRGLVTRETDPDNRRSVLITLTDAGLDVIDRAVTDHVSGQAESLAALSPGEQDQLAALLRKLLLSHGDTPARTQAGVASSRR